MQNQCAEIKTKEAALIDAQDVAELVLNAEAKLGEILSRIQFTKGGRGKTGSSGGTSLQDKNITKKESHYAQTIAKNPQVVEEVKKKAKVEGRIPTTQDVVKEVQRGRDKVAYRL